mgnify:FL=1
MILTMSPRRWEVGASGPELSEDGVVTTPEVGVQLEGVETWGVNVNVV